MNGKNGPADGWLRPVGMPVLADADVHVWRAQLELPAAQLTTMRRLLSPDELARADRFHFDRDRCHFIAARAILRVLLGGYLGAGAGKLRFNYNAHGKPAVAYPGEFGALCFNLSHSHELALYAVSRNRPLGIDVEQIPDDVPCERIARYVLSPRENVALHALPAQLRHEAFITVWTCKEAYVKARGEGLAIPLDQFEVMPALGEAAGSPSFRAGTGEVARWSLVALAPGTGYAGALVAEGRDWRVACWQWPGDCVL